MSGAARYDAIVLAGGRSSRMGGIDKVGVVVAGRPLLAHACDAVAGARRLVVVGPPGLADLPPAATRVQEHPPFAGPAAAMGAGLTALGDDAAEHVVVVAADVPRVADVVRALLAALAEHPGRDGVVARSSDGRRQPLLAAYRRAPFAAALAAHRPLANLSATRVTSGLDLVEVEVADDVIADVDTPADLNRFRSNPPVTEPAVTKPDDTKPGVDESVLVTWASDLAADLGIEQVLDVDAVLDLAADAAHGVMRPAAPLTTYLVGVAVGRAGGDPEEVAAVLQRVRAAIDRWPDDHPV